MVFCEHAWYFACFWHRFNVCARVRRKSYKNERNLLGILSSFLAHLLKFTKKKFESLSREPWCPPVCPPSTHCDAVNRTQCQHAFTPWPTSRLLSFPWVVFYIEENVRHHIPALYGFRLLRGATVFRYYIWYSRYSSGQNGVTFILSGPWSTTATYSIAAIWHKGTMANSKKKEKKKPCAIFLHICAQKRYWSRRVQSHHSSLTFSTALPYWFEVYTSGAKV